MDTSIITQNAASKQPNWNTRAPKLAQSILDTKVSFIVFQELYAKQRKQMDRLIGAEYGFAGAKNGRVIYYRLDRWRPDGPAKWAFMQGKTKPAIGRKFIHLKTKNKINIINVHLSYETTPLGQQKRRQETQRILKWADKTFPSDRKIFAGDWNAPAGSTTRPDVVGPIMTTNKYHDLGIVYGAKTGRGNYHLDRVFGSTKNTKPLEIRIIRHNASDHNGVFIKLTYNPK